MSEGTDWAWCYENPKAAASLINALEKERDALRKDAERWRAFRARDEFANLEYSSFRDMFQEDADKVIDAAIAAKETKAMYKIEKWGYCWTCGHDTIHGKACARSACPNSAAKGAQP